nr:nuclear transport factor 2 family protein [Polaribacter porphyrae]
MSKTIQNYYDGYIHRDLEKLEKAFDLEHGTMKVPIVKDNKVIGFKNRYFKEVVPKWGNRKKLPKTTLENCALHILNIDIVDNTIASAKISMKVDTIIYIDILSLNKIKGLWKITNKIYTVRK